MFVFFTIFIDELFLSLLQWLRLKIEIQRYLTEVLIMTSVVVVGTQWGDEGKGKITDFAQGRCHRSFCRWR